MLAVGTETETEADADIGMKLESELTLKSDQTRHNSHNREEKVSQPVDSAHYFRWSPVFDDVERNMQPDRQ